MGQNIERILRCKQVLEARGVSHTSHYRHIAEGLWTRSIRTSPKCAGWPASEVQALNRARIAGWSDAQIRALVKELHAAREAA